MRWQIYGECATLGWKLATLAAEINLTHVSATCKGRPAKRLKSCIENSSNGSKGNI